MLSTDTTRRNRDIQEKTEVEEASAGELFYDLFFVANLTTVTAVHYMVDHQSTQFSLPCTAASAVCSD